MAKKIFIFCATLAFCVLLTNASIYRTVVEVDEDDVTNPHRQGGSQSQQRCQREFQQAQQLQSCHQWIQQQVRQGGRGGGGYDPYSIVDFDFENPHGQQQRPHQLQQCCQELQQQDPFCVCPNLQRVAQAIRFQGQGQGQGQRQGQGHHQSSQVRQIYQTAKNLPQVCNIPQVGVCPFQSSPFSPYY